MTCGRRQYFLLCFVLAVVIFAALVVEASHRFSAESRNRMYLWKYSSTQAAIQLPAKGTTSSDLLSSLRPLPLNVIPFLQFQ
jgi:hypothetical protein